jgi:hypothetical protein
VKESLSQIHIKIPSAILEDKSLSHLQVLLLSISYTFHPKLGYNAATNKELSEMLKVDVTRLGKNRKELLSRGYERKEGKRYFLEDKVQKKRRIGKREILLVPEVYQIKGLSAGAKLLWAEYNSLSQGDKGKCIASREFLAKRLNCSEDSITLWHERLNDLGLLSESYLRTGVNTRQRVVKTKRFSQRGESKIDSEVEIPKQGKEQEQKVEIDESLKKAMKSPAIAVERPKEEDYWRQFMSDVNQINNGDYNAVEDYVFKVSGRINKVNLDQSEVFYSLYDQVDKKLQRKEVAIALKAAISEYQ